MVSHRLVVIVLVAAAAIVTSRTSAQRAEQAPAFPNFDIRTEMTAEAAAYRSRFAPPSSLAALASARTSSLADLEKSVRKLDLTVSPETGVLEVVGTEPGTGFLTGPSADRVATLKGFLTTYSAAYGLIPDQVASLELVSDYMNPAGNMGWVEFEQRINGHRVFRGLIRGGFTADGRLVRTTGTLAAGLDAAALPATPTLSAAQAVSRAASSVGWTVPESTLAATSEIGGRTTFARGPMANDARAWLVYFPLSPGLARLAWVTEVWGDPDVFMIALDADDGTVLFRKNLTSYQSQPATYVVYNNDSPAPMSPSTTLPGLGIQAPPIQRTMVTLVGNEGPLSFNLLGWIADGVEVTDGNAVQAGIDRIGANGVDAPVTGPGRVFDFSYNPAPGIPAPGEDPLISAYQMGEVTNGFYWTNRYHDALYQLGFTEAARNFQHNNFGRGGLGLDRISAEFQDISGVNNANFSAAADGARGRMQMYIFNGATPNRSSGLDAEVLLHELTHGTSSRLHTNASGLFGTMSGGMGEGWSDFFARSLLSTPDEDPNGIYPFGAYVTYLQSPGYVDNYYYGIRRFPYAVRSNVGPNGRPHNPLTLADIDATQINLTDGAFPPGPLGSPITFQVHNIGEVWASALFEVRARFMTRLGNPQGNQRFLQIVIDAMKLEPASPTMLQGRDAILAASAAMAASESADPFEDMLDIWAGFAARGMGQSARIINPGNGSVVEAFDVPGISPNGGALVAESVPNGWLDPGETVTMSLCVRNLGAAVSGAVVGALQGTGGVLSPSGPQDYGVIAPNGSACRTFSFIVSGTCGERLTATLQAQEAGGLTRYLSYDFQLGSGATPLNENFDGVTVPALPAGWTSSVLAGSPSPWATTTTVSETFTNNVFASAPATISDNVLVTPAIAVPIGGAVLSFRHASFLEANFDGGVLEISIAGGPYEDVATAGGVFISGGYTGGISVCCGNPIAGRQAWTGLFNYMTSSVRLPTSANGQSVRLRWRLATDNKVGSVGWHVDSILLLDVSCGAVAPLITTQPLSQAIRPGASATLSVYAAGSRPLGYQWYLGASGDVSNPIGGATASTYSTPALMTPTAYWVRVSNAFGSANSSTASLTIGPSAGSEMVTNGEFSAPIANGLAPSGWNVFEEPDIIYSVAGGVFQFYRANPMTTSSGQATIFQNTGLTVAANTALRATFDIGNSSSVRKRLSVLVIDSDFSDINVCTFWLEPGAALATYTMRTHARKNWANAAIYFYAATRGADGGNYLLDNVSLTTQAGQSTARTDCVDPTTPAAPGGSPGPNLLSNGDFATGALNPWATFGVITTQVAGGVLEFIRPGPAPAAPAGTVFQATGQTMTANEFLTATFQLGNSSAVRKRVTVLLVGDGAFSDLMACTFWLDPGQGLRSYAMQGRTTKAWTDATIYFYAATIGNDTWMRLDNVTLATSPGTTMSGTECIEPVPPLAGAWSTMAPYPPAVRGHAVTSVGGELFVFGGSYADNILSAANKFDGAVWTTIAPLPDPLYYPAAVTNGTDVFLVGGLSGTDFTAKTNVYRYNVATNLYTTLAPCTIGTFAHAAVYFNGKIYKFGGADSNQVSVNALEIYDVATNSWSAGANYPIATGYLSAWVQGNYIYAAGGYDASFSGQTLKTYRYDPASNVWDDAAIADLPLRRSSAAVAFYDGRGVLIGGYVEGINLGNISASVVSWDANSNTWGYGPDLPSERAGTNGAVLNGSLHVIGGSSIAANWGTTDNFRLGTGSPLAIRRQK